MPTNERMHNCRCGAKRAALRKQCDKCTYRARWRRRKSWRVKSSNPSQVSEKA